MTFFRKPVVCSVESAEGVGIGSQYGWFSVAIEWILRSNLAREARRETASRGSTQYINGPSAVGIPVPSSDSTEQTRAISTHSSNPENSRNPRQKSL